jgi:hypothetical protein
MQKRRRGMDNKSKIPYGSLVRDKITGFKGYTDYRVEYLNGCVRYGVQPKKDKNGELMEAKIFDAIFLEVIAPPRKNLPKPIEHPNKFKLGVKVQDILSGFTGITVARIKGAYSGDRYGIQAPINKKGEVPEVKTMDEDDLIQIDPPVPKEKKEKKEKKKNPPNGPHNHNVVVGR